MTFARIVLWIAALVFGGVGIGFLIAPVAGARVVEILLPTPTARTDLRATYGGFDLAIGVWLALAALRPEWTRPGLMTCGLALAGFATGRLIGITLERGASRLMLAFLSIEIVGALITFAALGRLPL